MSTNSSIPFTDLDIKKYLPQVILSFSQNIAVENRVLFVCWFSNTISKNRMEALKVLSKFCNVKITLITMDTINSWENMEIPIHPGFKYLTDVHKSDYARAYLMYFYGGAYSDIKANSFDFNPYFDDLLNSDYDAVGYAERNAADVANFYLNDNKAADFVQNNYFDFAGNGHFIFKPRTQFAHEWIKRVHKIMDQNYGSLKNSPGIHPFMVKGGIHKSYHGYMPEELIYHGYPFDWTTIGGTVRHRLEYEYGLNVFKKIMPFPNINNYR